jgi:hypothetical protein
MRMHTKSGRSRWPYVIGSALVVVAVAGGLVYTANQPTPEPAQSAAPAPTPTATAPAAGGSGASDGDEGAAPTGCLGGPIRDAVMVAAAQSAAPHTTYGAIEVATSFYRFFWQSPSPAVTESSYIADEVIASTANAAWKDVAAQYESDAWAQLVAEKQAYGSAFYVSTANGIWRVTEDSTSDRVTVEVAVGYVFDDVLSPTEVAGMGLVMVWENDAWRVEGGVGIDQDKLAAGGTRFTGGC